MATTTVKSIGTATRDYSTFQAWEDACPANLVTSDVVWKGEVYNDSEFTAGVTISGITTDSTRYPWLTTASGESAFDSSSNPLVYNQTNGVGCSISWSGVTNQVSIGADYALVEKIQFDFTNTTGGYYPARCLDLSDYAKLKDTLIEANIASGSGASYVVNSNTYYGGRDSQIVNVLVVMTRDSASSNSSAAFRLRGGHLINSGVVCPSNLTNPNNGTLITDNGYQSSSLVKNCYVFGGSGSAFASGTWQTGSDYNATDDSAAPGGNSQTSLTFANQFTSTTNTDWKLKSGSDLIAGGNTDASYPDDIYGTTRGTTTDGDVGPFEYTAGGGVSIDVPVGALGLTGFSPTPVESNHQTVNVPVAMINPAGQVPTVVAGADVSVDVPLASLSISAFSPTPVVTDHKSVDVPVGSIDPAGQAPTVVSHVTLTVPIATMGLVGYAPTVVAVADVSVNVPVAVLSLSAFVPGISTSADVSVDVPVAALSLTGYAGTILNPNTINIPNASLTLTGIAPSVGNHQTIEIPVGDLTITGIAPTLDITANQLVSIPLADLVLAGFTPTADATNHQSVDVPVAAFTLTGYVPLIVGTTQVGFLTATLTLSPAVDGAITLTEAVSGTVTLN